MVKRNMKRNKRSHKKSHKRSHKRRSRHVTNRMMAGMDGAAAASDLADMFASLGMGAARAATSVAQTTLPQGPAGPLVVMSARAPARGRTRGPSGASARMHVDPSRSSRRTVKKTKRYSPPKAKKKTQTASQKQGTMKAKRTRATNKSQGFSTTLARRKAAAKKGRETKKSNQRFKGMATDMAAALADIGF